MYIWTDIALEGAVVNRKCLSLNIESLEIRSTVPLNYSKAASNNYKQLFVEQKIYFWK